MNKLSQYNIFCKMDCSNSVVYNSFTRKYSIISSSNHDNIGSNDTHDFLEKGIIVNFESDEYSNLVSSIQEEVKNGPQTLTIFPTTDCNARCWYCYEKGIAHSYMSSETISNVITFVKKTFNHKEIKINWFGGEPLMNIEAIKQITQLLKSSRYELQTTITTNGSRITEDFIEFLCDNYSHVTINTSIDEIGDKYGRIKGYNDISYQEAYNKIIANVTIALKRGIKILLRINYTDFNRAQEIYSHLKETFNNYQKSECYIYYAPIWDSTKKRTINQTLAFVENIRKGYDINVLADPFLDNIVLNNVANVRRLAYCSGMNKNHYVINADGMLYRCHSLVSDKKYSCGDIINGVDESSLGYQIFECKTSNDECEKCSVAPICMVQCKARSVIYGKENICSNTKDIIEHIIKLKVEINNKRRSQ